MYKPNKTLALVPNRIAARRSHLDPTMKITKVTTHAISMPLKLDGDVPQGPGLGIDPDPGVLKHLAIAE